ALRLLSWCSVWECGPNLFDARAPAGVEVRRRVSEAGDLSLLSGQIHNRVADEIDERDRPLRGGRRKISDRHADVFAAWFRPEPGDHRSREVDADSAHAPLRERERDSPGSHTELKCTPFSGEPRQERNRCV